MWQYVKNGIGMYVISLQIINITQNNVQTLVTGDRPSASCIIIIICYNAWLCLPYEVYVGREHKLCSCIYTGLYFPGVNIVTFGKDQWQ